MDEDTKATAVGTSLAAAIEALIDEKLVGAGYARDRIRRCEWDVEFLAKAIDKTIVEAFSVIVERHKGPQP